MVIFHDLSILTCLFSLLLQVAYNSFKYWKLFSDSKEIEQAENSCEYPPRFHIECYRTEPNQKLLFTFSIAKLKGKLDKNIAEFLLVKNTTGSYLQL